MTQMPVAALNLIEIPNPFRPDQQIRTPLEFKPGASVEDLFPQVAMNDLEIGLNGMVIAREDRATTFVSAGDYLVVCPVLAGGGGGKSVLRIVALIAVAVVAPYAGGALYGALGGTFVTASAGTAIAALTGGVMIAGGLMVNALLPAPKPPGNSSSKDSPSYGIDGAKNTAAEGIVTPICYGTFRMAGNIINNYTINDGDTQWLHMLINAGEGEVESITDIELNELPIDTFELASTPYKDIESSIQLGTADQGPPKWFEDTIVPQSIGHKLTTDWRLVTTTGLVDKVRIDFSCPSGLFQAKNNGELSQLEVPIEIQYSVAGANVWNPLPQDRVVGSYEEQNVWSSVTYYDEFGSPSGSNVWVPGNGEYREGNVWYANVIDGYGNAIKRQVGTVVNKATYTGGAFLVKAVSRNAVRRSFSSDVLAEGVYDLRVRRTTVEKNIADEKFIDMCYLTDVNEITLEDVGYRHTATVAIKTRLGDQLNGLPNVTYLNHGKKVKVWNEAEKRWESRSSSNPAWVSFDILSNRRYGGGAALSRFDLPAWKDWARFCDENNLQFNGVFDTQTNVWDANQIVMRCGHASLVRVGTRYTIAIERAEDPVMMFSVANMIQGSFEETWHSLSERANEIEGTFYDKNNNYKPSPLRVYDEAAITAGHAQRSTSVDLRGVTDAQQAWDDLNIMLNINRYIRRTVKFSATMESLACSVGSVVLVQHDMPKWGAAGRVEAGCSNTELNLDREVTIEHGVTYKALIHHSKVLYDSGVTGAVVHSGDETSAILVGFDGAKVPHRFLARGKDVRVLGVFTSGASHGVTIEALPGLTNGDAFELWDTDVIETRNVINTAAPGTPHVTTSVMLALPLSGIPAQYTNFMFGPVGKVAKPFRVKAISGSSEYKRDLTCVEYNATVYDPNGAVPTPNYSGLNTSVDHVTIEGVYERMSLHGMSYKSRVTVSYSSTQQTYQTSNVYLSRDNGPWTWVGKDIYGVTVDGAQGEQLRFRVVAMDVVGRSAPESSAPTYTYNVQGKDTTPDSLQDLGYEFTDTGILFSFEAPLEQDWLTSQGSTTETFDPGTIFFDAKATTFLWPFQAAGTYPVWFRSLIQGNLTSSPVAASVVVQLPEPPTITSAKILGGVVMIKWDDARTSQPIKNYEIRLGTPGDTFATATLVATPPRNSNAFSVVIEEIDTHRIFVRATDMGGNHSAVAFADVTTVSSKVNRLVLTPSSQVIRVSPDGLSMEPPVITLTATMGGELIGEVASFTTIPAVTLGGTGNERTLAAVDFGGSNTVQVTASVTIGDDTYTDVTTIVKLSSGENAISFVLSNEATILPCDAEGEVTDFTGANTAMFVYRGVVDDTENWTFSIQSTNVVANVVDNVVTVTAWLGDGAITTDILFDELISTHVPGFTDLVLMPTSSLNDMGYVDIIASRPGYQSQLKRFTLSRARAGAGGEKGEDGEDGADGEDGVPGPRGNVNVARQISGSSWSNSEALLALLAGGYGAPQALDIVTLYNSAAGYSETRFYDGSAWLVLAEYVNGNMVVNGTLGAQKIVAHSITATQLIQTVALITQSAQIGNLVVKTGHIDDLSVSTLKIQDEAVIVPRFVQGTSVIEFGMTPTVILTAPSVNVGGAKVMILATLDVPFKPEIISEGEVIDIHPSTARIKRDGTTIASFDAYSKLFILEDTPGVGDHTYTLTVETYSGTGGAGHRTLLLLGVKK